MNLSSYLLNELSKSNDERLTHDERLTINELLEKSVFHNVENMRGKAEKLITRKRIYSYLSKKADNENKVYGASQSVISKDLDISSGSVSLHLIEMDNWGIIDYLPSPKSNEPKLIVLTKGGKYDFS